MCIVSTVRNIMILDGLVNGVQGFVQSFKYTSSNDPQKKKKLVRFMSNFITQM